MKAGLKARCCCERSHIETCPLRGPGAGGIIGAWQVRLLAWALHAVALQAYTKIRASIWPCRFWEGVHVWKPSPAAALVFTYLHQNAGPEPAVFQPDGPEYATVLDSKTFK